MRATWTLGTRLDVYGRTDSQWCHGVVTQVTEDRSGNILLLTPPIQGSEHEWGGGLTIGEILPKLTYF